MAEEFDGGGEVFGGHAVEAAVGGEESGGGEDVEVGVEDEVIAEGVDGGDGSEFAIGEVEAGAEDFLEGLGGGGVGRWRAKRVFIRTIFVRGKN